VSKTVGQIIKMARKNAGLTQLELAERMGIKANTSITYLENGKYQPSVEQLHRIAQALDITIDNLLPQEWLSQAALHDMEMTLNEYQKAAARTMNPKLYPEQQANHALHGMVGEIGEIHSLYQKSYQGHPVECAHLKKELGDLLWFIAEYCTAMGWTLEDVAQLNIDKLKARYPEGFSADKSLHRKEGDI
jgi:transcriptional regulator with XRE-family HTH domain